MSEELLQFIWQNRLFDKDSLFTHTGEKIEVIHVGNRSNNSGPDFINSRIKVGETIWAGNTEIHVQSSDWFKHGHNEDKAYDNVILHVVKKNNAVIRRLSGEEIPTLELIYNPFYEKKYEELKSNHQWIPCQKDFFIEDEFLFDSWLERLCIERLEQKSARLQNLLAYYRNDWEESFYSALATNLGYKINAQPFEMLAKSVPLNTLLRHKDSLLQIEALLFGQAGFLSASLFDDAYFNTLKKEYLFLRKKYELKPLENHLWQFMRLRPAGFPTVRIAQLASLVFRTNNLFSRILETSDLQRLRTVFRAEPSSYWITHYQFNKQGVSQVKLLGSETIDSIIINTVVPFLFYHGITHGSQKFKDRAVEFLSQLDAEQNSIVKEWETLGFKPKNAMSTQSLLQLKNEYCNRHKCLSCQVGMWILSKKF
jgi:Protein of unknown function (DUF2851)